MTVSWPAYRLLILESHDGPTHEMSPSCYADGLNPRRLLVTWRIERRAARVAIQRNTHSQERTRDGL